MADTIVRRSMAAILFAVATDGIRLLVAKSSGSRARTRPSTVSSPRSILRRSERRQVVHNRYRAASVASSRSQTRARSSAISVGRSCGGAASRNLSSGVRSSGASALTARASMDTTPAAAESAMGGTGPLSAPEFSSHPMRLLNSPETLSCLFFCRRYDGAVGASH